MASKDYKTKKNTHNNKNFWKTLHDTNTEQEINIYSSLCNTEEVAVHNRKRKVLYLLYKHICI